MCDETTRPRRPRTAILLAVCAWHAAGWLSLATARAEIIDRALVVVAGVVITQSDATAAAELGVVSSGETDKSLAGILAQLVERQLMLTEVDRSAPPEPSTDAVERRLQEIRARFASTPAYEAVLRRSGIDEMRLRQTLRDQLRIDAYLDQRFSAPPLTAERRAELIKEWVAGLKRRADISYLDVPRS
jgi:phage gp36-like protein